MSLQQLSCQFCGATLRAPEQPDRVKCDYCGAELTVLVAERIEIRQEAHIPEAILLAEPLPAPRTAPGPPPAPPAPPTPAQHSSTARSERLDIPPWAERLLFRAVREFFRRR
jgi:hypothetical protein